MYPNQLTSTQEHWISLHPQVVWGSRILILSWLQEYHIFTRKDLPASVALSEIEFMDGLKEQEHTTVIDNTSGVSLYLFLDLHGDNNRPVRVVFDTGASISLWLASAVKDGRLRAYLDKNNPTTITGLGKGKTQAQTATVLIPGNEKGPDGRYPAFLSKSTIVNEIIPALPQNDLAPLISSILSTASELITLPEDMRLNNFQHQIGGTVEGLIGIKHIQQLAYHIKLMLNSCLRTINKNIQIVSKNAIKKFPFFFFINI